MIKAKSQFKRRSTANNVEIVIPVPADADSPKFKTTIGSVKYAPEQNAITWTVKSFPVSFHYYDCNYYTLIVHLFIFIMLILTSFVGKGGYQVLKVSVSV
jgi:hypothetical protein